MDRARRSGGPAAGRPGNWPGTVEYQPCGPTTSPEETLNATADMARAVPIYRRPDISQKFAHRALR